MWQTALPLAGVLTLGVIAASIFLPDIKTSTAPILVLVALTWLITDRLIAPLIAAIRLAEIEQRNAEQQRLLETRAHRLGVAD